MKYRHEVKHVITYPEMLVLKQRLSAVMKTDPHAVNGKYEIRSLYFDTPRDDALREKIEGAAVREKFRIRFYNGDSSFICLEKKSKIDSLCAKQSAVITKEKALAIVSGTPPSPDGAEDPLLTELYYKMRTTGLKAKTIVDYTRIPFVFAPGNVRVTLDGSIRTGLFSTDLFGENTVTVPAGDGAVILEVKWDEFLPDIIKDAVALPGIGASAFSKYAVSRRYF